MTRIPVLNLGIAITVCAWLSGMMGCISVSKTPPTLPIEHVSERGQLVFYSDFPLTSNHRLLHQLETLREDVLNRFELPISDEAIRLYLFEDAPDYYAFMKLHYPDLPPRRAYFIQTDTRLIVYAHWGDHIAEDLRHEVTHGYLHAVAPSIPVWIDEGIAEYFENPPNIDGFHAEHLNLLLTELRTGRWTPDLAKLETLHTLHDMSHLRYAESWAWVHFLLHSRPDYRAHLVAHLQAIQQEQVKQPLYVRLAHTDYRFQEHLVEHLQRLRHQANQLSPHANQHWQASPTETSSRAAVVVRGIDPNDPKPVAE